jgi:hypothetical protein
MTASTSPVSRALLRALENLVPCTIETVEGPFELVLGELPREVLQAYRGSQRAVCCNSPTDVSSTEVEPGLAYCIFAIDRQRNVGRLASTLICCRRGTRPLTVTGISIGIAGLRQEQQIGD